MMCPDVPGAAEVKDQFDFAHQVLAAFIGSFILGGVTIVSLVVRRPLFQSFAYRFFRLLLASHYLILTSNFQLIGSPGLQHMVQHALRRLRRPFNWIGFGRIGCAF